MTVKEKAEETQLAADPLADLPVIEEQAAETKGAGTPTGKIYVATNTGVFV